MPSSSAVAENARIMTALIADGGSSAGGPDWPKLIGESLRSSGEIARSLWEASIKVQVEMVELGAKLVVASNERLGEQLESIGRAFESSTSTMVKSLAGASEHVAAEAPARKRAA